MEKAIEQIEAENLEAAYEHLAEAIKARRWGDSPEAKAARQRLREIAQGGSDVDCC
jgi:hypothetical protein